MAAELLHSGSDELTVPTRHGLLDHAQWAPITASVAPEAFVSFETEFAGRF
jgi:hypothetical protein